LGYGVCLYADFSNFKKFKNDQIFRVRRLFRAGPYTEITPKDRGRDPESILPLPK
jgi:hypothetical protein